MGQLAKGTALWPLRVIDSNKQQNIASIQIKAEYKLGV